MDVCAPAPAVETATPCIARQPILTSDQKVVGYELFFREGREQDHFTSDAEVATSKTLDALNTIGLDVLCDGQPAFINCTRPMLLTEYFTLLPPRDIVVEIQETGTR
jgi:c-di-GMP-related signal transduction protein